MLKALVLTPDFPPARGGIQLLVDRLVRNMRGVDSQVITIEVSRSEAVSRPEVTRVGVPLGKHALGIARLNRVGLLRALGQRPDVILSGHIVTSPAAALAGRILGVPWLQYVYAKEMGARRHVTRFAVSRADRVVAISHYSRSLALAAGAPPDRMTIIPPGVDLAPEPIRVPAGEPPTVITVSRLEERYKGHDVVLRALPLIRSRVPDARWVVIGDGPLRPVLEDAVQRSGVADAVRIVGSADDEERDDWFARSRVFAMLSRLPSSGLAGEGFGIVYLEAATRGLPSVGGDVGGSVDAVVDGETGRLVDPTDHVMVADAIGGLLEDTETAGAMGRAGREFAAGFAWPLIADRVEAELRALVERGPTRSR